MFVAGTRESLFIEGPSQRPPRPPASKRGRGHARKTHAPRREHRTRGRGRRSVRVLPGPQGSGLLGCGGGIWYSLWSHCG